MDGGCRGGMNVLLGSRLGQASSTSQPEAGPWLTLRMEGHVSLTVCSYHALFHTILLFLQVIPFWPALRIAKVVMHQSRKTLVGCCCASLGLWHAFVQDFFF